MSHVGKNIKKIRSVKNFNQTQFAELFNLKRASIGAYEEGRAEPKIATLSQIANYFGITIDDLLNKELSVNDLYHFDIFQKDYIKNKGNQLKPSKLPVSLSSVYYITETKREDYFKGADLSAFIKLNLPLPSINSDYLAFEANTGTPWINAKGAAIPFLVCRKLRDDDLSSFISRAILIYKEGQFYFGKLEQQAEQWSVRMYNSGERIVFKPAEDASFLSLYELANSLSNS